ncbi:MAG: hypothetical protein RLT05_37440 [Bauldia litoralis]
MSGLAHHFERNGLPTVVIGLIREHVERMRPPRALFVPFQLGRPFGAPNEPAFQRRVLKAALGLLVRTVGPILADFPEAPPEPPAPADGDEEEGWACPVTFPLKADALSDAEKFRLLLKQEIALLRPWYGESVKRQGGRRLDGLTGHSPEQIVDHLVGYLDDPTVPSFVEGEPIHRAIKLCADDLKHFCYQAALSRPGSPSGLELDTWFFGQTLAGKLHIELRALLMTMDDPALHRVGAINLVPHTMTHLVESGGE